MKSLQQYINEKLKEQPNFYKRFGIIVDELEPYDYDKFLINNNLTATDESYHKFVEYTDTILATLPFNLQSTYEDYQKSLYNLNERLGDSLDYNELIKKLQKDFCFGEVIDIVKSKSETAKNFVIKTSNINIKDNPMFISLLSYYNYYINAVGEDYMQLAPYKPHEATKTIYDDLYGILYHICTKDQLSKIRKNGLVPRNIKSENVNRPYRRFYIGDDSKKNIINELSVLSNSLVKGINRRNKGKQYNINKNDIVFLKVDLNKSSRKFKFFNDDSASGYHAYFTEETIPPYCIEIFEDLNEI